MNLLALSMTLLSLSAMASSLRIIPRQSTSSSSSTENANAVNITIDDTLMLSTPESVYGNSLYGYVSSKLEGNWTKVVANDIGFRGTFLWTWDPKARAELTFMGVAVYFYAPRYIFQHISVDILVDGAYISRVDLTTERVVSSHGTSTMNVSEPSQVVWKREGMEYGEHTIVVKPSVDSEGLSFGVLDALVFTALTDRDGKATVEPNSLRSSTDTTLRIALSTTISILAALLILALFLAYRRRKLQRQIHQQKSVGVAGVGNTGVRRWVDMRWVNSSKTELDKAGVERVGGDAVHMDKL